jgi:EAL domain-containing protein (putative c-di-GMP-specific phosphodiesterase class I)
MRWHDEELGMVPPDQFIPIAEDLGLILKLGEFALRDSCQKARQWLDDGLGAFRMAVNLSPAQFAYQDLVDLVSSVLAETGLPPQLLELEITEGILMRDGLGAVQTIRRLHELGVTMAIDDFGSGYSSLSYLKRFNVDKIKIDRSFVKDLPHDPDDVTIAKTIINLGHSLGMEVLAEGVEEELQQAFLATNGCDEIQGYFLAKPLAEPDFITFLQSRESSVAAE